MLEANWTKLSLSSQDVVMDIAEYAWPKTVEGCWITLDKWLDIERITKTTYDEIKANVTFEENDES